MLIDAGRDRRQVDPIPALIKEFRRAPVDPDSPRGKLRFLPGEPDRIDVHRRRELAESALRGGIDACEMRLTVSADPDQSDPRAARHGRSPQPE